MKPDGAVRFNDRQRRIMRLITQGLSYAEIGKQLTSPKHPQGITGGVVRNYARTIAEKIDDQYGLPAKARIKMWMLREDAYERKKAG